MTVAELVPVDPSPPAYVTHGRKYHTDPTCPLMLYGEYLHDWDGDDYDSGWTAGSYRREERSSQYAAMCGKLPCLGCVPVSLRVFPPLYGQTFGHEPVDNPHYGPVCARCLTHVTHYDEAYRPTRYVKPTLWPCTSATILGLVPRTVEQDAALRKVVWGCETPETHNWDCTCPAATPAP